MKEAWNCTLADGENGTRENYANGIIRLMETLNGKVALVTGGSRGIGAAVALALAGAGVDVAVNFRARSDALRKFALRSRNWADALSGFRSMFHNPIKSRKWWNRSNASGGWYMS